MSWSYYQLYLIKIMDLKQLVDEILKGLVFFLLRNHNMFKCIHLKYKTAEEKFLSLLHYSSAFKQENHRLINFNCLNGFVLMF